MILKNVELINDEVSNQALIFKPIGLKKSNF